MSETPLNQDELATAYLNSRDVPCPNCAYNRRGGVTAACPECGHVLDIIHESGGWQQQHRKLATRILTMLMVLCIAHLLLSAYSTITWLNVAMNGMMPGLIVYFYLIQGVIGLIAYLTLSIITARARKQSRTNQDITVKGASSPMLIYLIITILFWVASFLAVFLR